MSIIDKIKESVEALGLAFEYGSLDNINELVSSHDFDGGRLCYCTLITTGTATQDAGGVWHDSVQVGLFVVDKTEYDPCSLENENIITGCKNDVYRWLLSVRNGCKIKVQTVTGSQRVYDEFDDIVTGYGVQVTVEEKDGFGPCDL